MSTEMFKVIKMFSLMTDEDGYAEVYFSKTPCQYGNPATVCPGDWIITSIKNEYYPCKPDIFNATYDYIGDLLPQN